VALRLSIPAIAHLLHTKLACKGTAYSPLKTLGSAVTVNTRVAYLSVLVVLLGFWVKSRQEEILLEQHFQNTGPTGTG